MQTEQDVKRPNDPASRVRSENIQSIDELEDELSKPTPGVSATLGRLEGDIVILGVAGKMGPSLARMIKRASDATGAKRRVFGVARFSDRHVQTQLQSAGIEPFQCDLLDE